MPRLNRFWRAVALSILPVAVVSAATFGRVVPIGGPAADLALDQGRNVLYIANYTSSRIDVMSLTDNSIARSINVAAYPNSIAISMNGRYLLVTHYASSNGSALWKPGQDALTVIDLTTNQKRTFGLSSGPLGVAFGYDNLALIVTQNEFLQFDPVSGMTKVVQTFSDIGSQLLPVPLATFPSQISGGAMAATADGRHILGVLGVTPDGGGGSVLLRFSYNAANQQITAAEGLTTAPSLAPRAISISADTKYYMSGWALIGCGFGFLGDCTADGPLLSQWPNASGNLNVGTVAIRSSKSLIYAQFTPAKTGTTATNSSSSSSSAAASVSSLPPNLLILDSDNLAVRDRIQIPENLAGRSVFNSDESVMYSISDSGITVFNLATLDKAPRVTASAEDVVFRGNFCAGGPLTQTVDIVDQGGSATPFQICASGAAGCTVPGVKISPSYGVTPARVTITIDPSVSHALIGTKALQFDILSPQAINMPAPPARGVAEAGYKANVRNRFRVLINNRVPENRGAMVNVPGQLADVLADPARNQFYVLRQDKNQILVFDASSYKQIATLRTANTPTQMAITFDRSQLLVGHDNSQLAYRFDLNTLKPLPPIVFPMGHYPRSIAASSNAILAASRVAGPVHTIDRIDLLAESASTLPSLGPYKNDVNVSTTLMASPNGANVIAAMPDGNLLLYSAAADTFTASRKDFSALKGNLAASSSGSYIVDRYLFNQSLVSQGPVVDGADTPSGFVFTDTAGISTVVDSSGSGYVQRLTADGAPLPTGITEAPLTSDSEFPFARWLAPMADRSAFVQLTTSGFTVLPWNYDAAIAPPVLSKVVSAADLSSAVAPGGLAAVLGSGLSPVTMASADASLPTVLADSCLTLNGATIPMQFVSPTRINAQLPFGVDGKAELVLHTPNGVSDTLFVNIQSTAPSVFLTGSAGPVDNIATIFRATNGNLVTNSNPVHNNDRLVIYLTGMGKTFPGVDDGAPAPSDPLSVTLVPPTVTLGGTELPVEFAGLTPGSVGVYQINVVVPFKGVPTGFDIPLTVSQGGSSTMIPVRVVN